MRNRSPHATRAFLCHSGHYSEFVTTVAAHLKHHLAHVFYFEDFQRGDRPFQDQINEELKCCDVFVLFVGRTVTRWQHRETAAFLPLLRRKGRQRTMITVRLLDGRHHPYEFPPRLRRLHRLPVIEPASRADVAVHPHLDGHYGNYATWVAAQIVHKLKLPWRSAIDLPLDPHLFDYEKDIIQFFIEKAELGDDIYKEPTGRPGEPLQREKCRREEMRRKLLEGCPHDWPNVERYQPANDENPLRQEIVGSWRHPSTQVVAAALTSHHQGRTSGLSNGAPRGFHRGGLCLSEAGPREYLHFPQGSRLRVAILASGGIAPGINAVVDGIVQRHWMYAERHNKGLDIFGLRNGFHAFADINSSHITLAAYRQNRGPEHVVPTTAAHVSTGGCLLGTSRMDSLLRDEDKVEELRSIADQLSFFDIDILYVIGGDGSMKAAHALWSVARDMGHKLSVVAIPKTMDNDILWMWQSFGFASAVEKAREIIENLHTEVTSNPRLCVIQLFGSDSGFVVSHAVLASATDQCDAALIPEVPFSIKELARHVQRRMLQRCRERIPHGLIVMAETAIPTDALEYVNRKDIGLTKDERDAIRHFCRMRARGRRFEGQTNDFLRSGGLKIASQALRTLLQNPPRGGANALPPAWKHLRVMTNEPRHILRAVKPNFGDIILGQRLGTLAVDNAMAGFTDFMISQWLTEFVLVPLKLVVLGRKRIPPKGIFWRSVLAKTGVAPALQPQKPVSV